MYLKSWIRKGHRPDVTHSKDGVLYELIGSFRRGGWSHGVFVNQTCDKFLFVVEDITCIELAQANTFTELIDNVAEYYDTLWNKKKTHRFMK